MSKVVTPPDIVIEDTVYLIVNADVSDIEMVANLKNISGKNISEEEAVQANEILDKLRG